MKTKFKREKAVKALKFGEEIIDGLMFDGHNVSKGFIENDGRLALVVSRFNLPEELRATRLSDKFLSHYSSLDLDGNKDFAITFSSIDNLIIVRDWLNNLSEAFMKKQRSNKAVLMKSDWLRRSDKSGPFRILEWKQGKVRIEDSSSSVDEGCGDFMTELEFFSKYIES